MPQPGVHSFEVFGRIEERVLRSTDSRQKPRIFYNGSTLPFRNFTFATAVAPAPAPVMPVVVQAPPAPAPMPQSTISDAPPPSQPTAPALPASGYFDLDALYLSGPYAAYNRYSRSSILVQVQKKLKAAGLYTSSADGESGPGTQRAILAYQQAHSLPPHRQARHRHPGKPRPQRPKPNDTAQARSTASKRPV
ncbi:MAG: peptidoglycan-binding protein [Verrucomicrobiaceae bacterium]|nr:peptidoglycan-binding protein [Verrucomicrobiaceae bacterium]